MRRPGPTPLHPGDATGRGVEEASAELRSLYREYRRRQAFRLLSLLPPGALRPLYGEARERSGRAGEVVDPLTLLLDFCESILPLPPFDEWLEDRRAHPAPYLDDAPPSGGDGGTGTPVTVEVRAFEAGGTPWNAALNVHPDGDRWRGHIAFHAGNGASRWYATGEIFREEEAAAVRTRFLDFDDRTLRAFLRSALP